jgi:hypothetical protein
MELNPSWEAASYADAQEFSKYFMELESSLLFSQQLSISPYPELRCERDHLGRLLYLKLP